MRQSVFNIFAFVFGAVVVAVLVFIATVAVRSGMSLLHSFAIQSLPHMLQVLWTDPFYVIALIVAALLVWSWPREQEGGGYDIPVRRGRSVSRVDAGRGRLPPPRRGTSRPAGKLPRSIRVSKLRRA